MAHCFPSQNEIDKFRVKLTEGEAYLLQSLQNYLDDSFEIFVQPFLNGDRPDFVIMRRGFGIVIIEVKDWDLSCYTNPNGALNDWYLIKNNCRIKSPLAQVQAYKENLYSLHIDILFEKNIKNSKAFAIVQPVVYFHNATNNQIDNFCGNVPYLHFLVRDGVNEDGINNLLKLTRLNRESYLFDEALYQSFRRFLNPPLHSPDIGRNIIYNKEQERLVKSSANTRQKIKGVAGSGKTQVLAGRAANAYCRTQSTVLILTFNITLRNYIHDRINEVRLPFPWSGFEITNYHQFFKSQANNHSLSCNSFDDFNNEDFFDSVTGLIQRYETILVDEIQDYEQTWLKILLKYFLSPNGEFVVFGDEKQNIYDREMGADSFPQVPTITGRYNLLNQSYRLDSVVMPIAQAFQREYFTKRYQIDEANAKPQQESIKLGEVQYISKSSFPHDDLYHFVREVILSLGIHPNNIAILASTVEPVRELEYRFRKLNRENTSKSCETKEEYDDITASYSEHNAKQKLKEIRRGRKLHFWGNAGTTKFSTIHSFKGWEADTVILIISEKDINSSDELIYVALTRTQRNLVIIDTSTMGRYSNFFNSQIA